MNTCPHTQDTTHHPRLSPSMDLPATADTPEGFLWRYAVGCIPAMVHPGYPTWDEESLQQAKHCVQHGHLPTRGEIRAWFVRPFDTLTAMGREHTLEDLQWYFRSHHRTAPEQDTPSYLAHIMSIDPRTPHALCTIEVLQGEAHEGAREQVVNCHQLPLTVGEIVFVHNGVIAELAPPEFWT